MSAVQTYVCRTRDFRVERVAPRRRMPGGQVQAVNTPLPGAAHSDWRLNVATTPRRARATPTQFLGSEALFIMPHLCDELETTQTLEGVLRERVGSRTWPVFGWRLAGPGSVSPL